MKFLIGRIKMMLFVFLSLSKSEKINLRSLVDPEDIDSNFDPEIVFPKVFCKNGLSLEKDFGKFDPNQKYIVAITGVTTGGKSSVASFLNRMLPKIPNCRSFVIHQDNYYKDDETLKKESNVHIKRTNNPLSSTDDIRINYESPGAYKWNDLKTNIISLLKNDKRNFVDPKYLYNTGEINEKKKEMPENINILIVEGLYAQNLFEDKSLDVSKYDPCNTSEEAINLYETSSELNKDMMDFIKANNIKVLKFFIDLPDDLIKRNRLKVDKERTNRSEEETKRMLDNFIIPSCKKWIRPFSSNSDYVFSSESRSLNSSVCVSMILKYFDENIDMIAVFKAFTSGFKKPESPGVIESFLSLFRRLIYREIK